MNVFQPAKCRVKLQDVVVRFEDAIAQLGDADIPLRNFLIFLKHDFTLLSEKQEEIRSDEFYFHLLISLANILKTDIPHFDLLSDIVDNLFILWEPIFAAEVKRYFGNYTPIMPTPKRFM